MLWFEGNLEDWQVIIILTGIYHWTEPDFCITPKQDQYQLQFTWTKLMTRKWLNDCVNSKTTQICIYILCTKLGWASCIHLPKLLCGIYRRRNGCRLGLLKLPLDRSVSCIHFLSVSQYELINSLQHAWDVEFDQAQNSQFIINLPCFISGVNLQFTLSICIEFDV